MGLFDFLFGSTDTSGQDAQLSANAADRDLFQRLAQQSRQDAIPLFTAAQEASAQGIQGALDIFGQTIPQQASLIQQGNLNAQNVIAGGLGGINAAILGLPQDLSQQALSQLAQPLSFNTDFAQVNLGEVFDRPTVQFTPGNQPLPPSQLIPPNTQQGLPSNLDQNLDFNFGRNEEITGGFETPFQPEAPDIELGIQDIFSRNLSVEQKALAVLQLAQSRGLTPEQLANQSSLTLEDILQGQTLTNFRL